MGKLRTYLSFITLLPMLAFGQLSEVGVFGGTTTFMGDVGNPMAPNNYAVGVVYRFQFDEYYSIRLNGMYGKISADDAQASSPFKTNRNARFSSDILEASILVEFNFFDYITGSRKKSHSPYIFGGIGVFQYNPMAEYNGNMYELRNLGTEGQGTSLSSNNPYGQMALNIPFGVGYRVSIGTNVSATFEVGFRATTTDYLDDVSGYYTNVNVLRQEKGDAAAFFADRSLTDTDKTNSYRGNAQNNDWYSFAGVTLFFALTPQKERCSRFRY